MVYRASIAEMVVPYADPSPVRFWQNYFDAGEYLFGRLRQLARARLRLPRRDPLHRRRARRRATATPRTITNAICLHEEDYGVLWKHTDLFTGTRRRPAGSAGW